MALIEANQKHMFGVNHHKIAESTVTYRILAGTSQFDPIEHKLCIWASQVRWSGTNLMNPVVFCWMNKTEEIHDSRRVRARIEEIECEEVHLGSVNV